MKGTAAHKEKMKARRIEQHSREATVDFVDGRRYRYDYLRDKSGAIIEPRQMNETYVDGKKPYNGGPTPKWKQEILVFNTP